MTPAATAAAPPVSQADEAPTILDIEASGFGAGSYPIEVGFVLPNGDSYCSLIRPAPHWSHWDPAAQRVHQIGRDALLHHGRSVDEVARELNERLRGRTVYSDGWAHDYVWLATLFDEAKRLPAFRLETLRALLSEDEAGRWRETKRQVGNEFPIQRHRASADARLLQMTFRRLRP